MGGWLQQRLFFLLLHWKIKEVFRHKAVKILGVGSLPKLLWLLDGKKISVAVGN